jgi:tetratricopeptide (TPR) repeat protein
MPNYYVGKNRNELIEWLLQTWLKEGPPVCFVEGFSGMGKTSIARSVIKSSELHTVMVEMPYASSDQADNLFLNLATELSEIGIDDLADAVTEGKSIDQALGVILNRPILIVIDEFQRAMDESGRPTSSLINFLGRLANHPNIPGRVLLLTNRIVERSKWSEAYTVRTLTGLSLDDAEDLLGKLLNDARRDDEIPQERRRDVVSWLGYNPRAIYVLVASLEKSSLDELIGLSPEIWEARDREVSAELLHKLESELLERTIELLLKPETATLLRRLSVHRKSVKRDAIEKLLSKGTQFVTVRDDLINRFLMEQHAGWFSLNPVVREISLQKLKGNSSELRQAHSHAADHYMRHFKATEMIDSGKLGGYFVEARYHLVQAQRDEEIGQIAGRFENYLKTKFSSTSPIPRQLDELNERIATLMALLETPGAKGLEFYLSRLYEARGSENDLRKALQYIQRATESNAPANNWVLRLQLEARFNTPLQVKLVAREGINAVPANQGVEAIYNIAAGLISKSGDIDAAIALLKEGITRVPVNSLSHLYIRTEDLLLRLGKIEEAINLLKEGIANIPRNFDRYKLIEDVLILIVSQQNPQALDDFLTSSVFEDSDEAGFALGKIFRLIISHEWEPAAKIAQREYTDFPRYRPLHQLAAFCCLCANNLDAAEDLIEKLFLISYGQPFDSAYWLKTWIALRTNNLRAAQDCLPAYLGHPVNDRDVNEQFLLKLWDTAPGFGTRVDLAYFFPILPMSLTGLPTDVARIPNGPSVIRHTIPSKVQKITASNSLSKNEVNLKNETMMKLPFKVFISYSHKDEEFKDELVTMLAGLQRRGIIDAWQDRRIEAGDEWYKSIQDAMDECDLALLLVSPDFIASRFIQEEELPHVLARREEVRLRVIPIIVRPCMWSSEPVLSDLQALPKDAKPVITFSKANGDRDQVWADIAKVIEKRATK